MEIGIVGSGSMGSLLAGRLSEVADVYLVSVTKRDDHVAAINDKGLVIEEKDGTKATYWPKAYLSSKELPKMDLVIVAVLANQTEKALRQNLNLIGEQTLVLSLQNGYGNDKDIEKFVDRDRIIIGTTSHGCTMKEPGYVYHAGVGDTHLGSLTGCLIRAQELADLLSRAGFKTEVSPNARELILRKLFINIGINPLTAIFDVDNIYIKDNPHLREVAKGLVDEAVEIANGEGFNFDREEIFKSVLRVSDLTGKNCSSMRADVLNKRTTEIDRINGAILNMAKAQGKKAPKNHQMVDLVKAKENLY